jgi:hypothetical protein
MIAVEADWPDAAVVDRHIRYRPPALEGTPPFQRFPTWMWRNTDFMTLVVWLRAHNAQLSAERQTRFYGLTSTVCPSRLPPCCTIWIASIRLRRRSPGSDMDVWVRGKRTGLCMDARL